MSETRAKSAESISSIEENTIQQVPLDQRHGRNRDMFTIWFGTNIMILAIVTGALATTVFGQPAWSAVLAIVLGNLFGAVFMALHSAQGPTLGVPQMVQTKGQFGSLGSVLIVLVVVCMYTGFFISILVFGGESLASVMPFLGPKGGILILACVSLAAAIWGYTLIHAYARVMTWAISSTAAGRRWPVSWVPSRPRRCGRSPMPPMCRITRGTCPRRPAPSRRSG
jgi:NCS1 family nucleobase:cation symporter-1